MMDRHYKVLEKDSTQAEAAKLLTSVPPHSHIRASSQRLYDQIVSSDPDMNIVLHCIQDGADITFQPSKADDSTLHPCVQMGHTAALRMLLATPQNVDFTVEGWWKRSPLHCICLHASSQPPHTIQLMKDMTNLIVLRLTSHPNDHVDWSQKDVFGDDFISNISYYDALSHLYPLVRGQPYFLTAPKPIFLTYMPSSRDWKDLCTEDQNSMQVTVVGYSRRLYHEVQKATPDLDVVKMCVNEGADVLFKANEDDYPLLSFCILMRNVEALRVLLDTKKKIDFTVTGGDDWCPLHVVCSSFLDSSTGLLGAIGDITAAIVNRLDKCPDDVVDWGQRERTGCDFLSLATREGILSNVYPLVRSQQYFTSALKPIPLLYKPLDDDWSRLDAIECSELQMPSDEEDSTRRLYNEVANGSPNFAKISQFITAGADILFHCSHDLPTLHFCIRDGHTRALELLLETSRDVDFTAKDPDEETIFHYLICYNNLEDMKAMLATIIDRLLRCPHDLLDWSVQDASGNDFLNLAVKGGILPELYPLVKHQPYFTDATTSIVLSSIPSVVGNKK